MSRSVKLTVVMAVVACCARGSAQEQPALDLRAVTLNDVPIREFVQLVVTHPEIIEKFYERTGVNPSLPLAHHVNGILSSDYGDGVVEEKDAYTSLYYPGHGVSFSTSSSSLNTPSGYERCAQFSMEIAFSDEVRSSAKAGIFTSPISWEINAKTRRQKIVVHLGNPDLWGLSAPGYGGSAGFDHGKWDDDSDVTVDSAESAILAANKSRPYLEGNAYVDRLVYRNLKGSKVNATFHFTEGGTLARIVFDSSYFTLKRMS